MIKFFRKIRQNLLSEGKTGKYIKYAVGEIILVVIGILMALSINNWNESRKASIQDFKFLQNLRKQIELDTIAMTDLLLNYVRISERLKEGLRILNDESSEFTNDEHQKLSRAIPFIPVFTPLQKTQKK